MKKFVFICILTIWIAGLGFSAGKVEPRTGTETVTVTDLAGREVTLPYPVERIALVRSRDIYEFSAVLGEDTAEKIIAWGPDIMTADKDAYDKYLERFPSLGQLPLVGDIFKDALSTEQVLALDPDVVITETFMIDRGYESIDRLEKAGVPLLFLDFSGKPFEDPQKSILLIGEITGRKQRAQEIVDYVDEQLDLVFTRLDSLDSMERPKPTIYVECGNLGPQDYGCTYGYNKKQNMTSWGAFLQAIRATNIASDAVVDMAVINPEFLLESNPDRIIISGAYWPAAGAMRMGYYADPAEARALLRAFCERPGWDTLDAVKNKEVYSLHHHFQMHSFSFVGLQQMVKWLYPEEFRDIEPEENFKEFHRRFLPVDYSGTWMVTLK
jgi:iron complex transport system substrate-binding protein